MIVGVGTEAMPYTELSNQTSHLAVGPVYSDRSPVGLSNQTGHLWNLSSQTGHLWDCLIRPATCGTCLVRPVTCGTSSPGCCGQVAVLAEVEWSVLVLFGPGEAGCFRQVDHLYSDHCNWYMCICVYSCKYVHTDTQTQDRSTLYNGMEW